MRATWWFISFGDSSGRGGVFSGDTAEDAVDRAGADFAYAAAIGPLPAGSIPEGHPLNVVLSLEEIAQHDPNGIAEEMTNDELRALSGDSGLVTDWRDR